MVLPSENTSMITDLKELESQTGGEYSRWEMEIRAALKTHKKFHRDGKRILKIYSSNLDTALGDGETKLVKYNLYWSYIESVKKAIFARPPRTIVRSNAGHNSAVVQKAESLAERTAAFLTSHPESKFYRNATRSVFDFMTVGRGVLWPTYEVKEAKEKLTIYIEPGKTVPNEIEVKEDEKGEQYYEAPDIVAEDVQAHYVHWMDYLESPARVDEEIRWRAKRALLTKSEVAKEFGDEVAQNIGYKSDKASHYTFKNYQDDPDFHEVYLRAEVWEIHNLEKEEIIYFSFDYPKLLKEPQGDELELKDFWSTAEPLKSTATNDNTIPQSDYKIYGYLLDKINELTLRMGFLVRAIKVAGVYDSKIVDMKDIFNQIDTSMLPVQDWAAFAESGGFTGTSMFVPIDAFVKGLEALTQARAQYERDFEKVSGWSEIMQGNISSGQSSAAIQEASHFTNIRISDKQEVIQFYLRDTIAIMLEIAFKQFEYETIMAIAGEVPETPEEQEVCVQAVELLKDDLRRNFAIRIETDSTIALNQTQEKRNRIEFMNMTGQFLQQVVQIAQFTPALIDAAIETYVFVLDVFKVDPGLKSKYISGAKALVQDIAKAKEDQPPDPAMVKIEKDFQAKMKEMELRFMEIDSEARQKSADANMKFEIKVKELYQSQAEFAQKFQFEINKFFEELNYKYQNIQAQLAIANGRNDAALISKQIQSTEDSRTKLAAAQIKSQTDLQSGVIKSQTEVAKANIAREGKLQGDAVKAQSDLQRQKIQSGAGIQEKIIDTTAERQMRNKEMVFNAMNEQPEIPPEQTTININEAKNG